MNQTVRTKIFNYLLMFLGFATTTSCVDGITEMPCMYGTPTMYFEVSGKVVNKDSAPIAGIKVSCRMNTAGFIATTFTAENGSFHISGTDNRVTLHFEDVDGPENGGEFTDKNEDISVVQIEKGNGNRYDKYVAKDVVIEMEEKK